MAGGKGVGKSRVSMWRYFVEAVTVKYTDFSGHASGREYVSFIMCYWMVYFFAFVAVCFVAAWIPLWKGTKCAVGLCDVALFLPFSAVTARRLHDAGFSAWFCLLNHIVVWWWLFCLVTWGKYGIKYDHTADSHVIYWVFGALAYGKSVFTIFKTLLTPLGIFILFQDLFPLISLFILSKLPSDPNSRYLQCPPLERRKKNVIIVGSVIYLGLAIFTSDLFSETIDFVKYQYGLCKRIRARRVKVIYDYIYDRYLKTIYVDPHGEYSLSRNKLTNEISVDWSRRSIMKHWGI